MNPKSKRVLSSANKVLLTLVLSITFISFIENKPKKAPVVIGYVAGYNGIINTGKIAVEKLTHINYAFVNIKNNKAVLESEKTDTVNFRNLNHLKGRNPELKILISIGGWSWSENFSDAVLTDSLRKVFAASAVEIIRRYKLDGVDIDWEYPSRPGEKGNVYRPEDKRNFTLMFQTLRKELDILEKETNSKKLLTTAVGGFPAFLDGTEMDKAHPYLDYINLMTYDFYSGEIAGHHTNLFPSKAYPTENYADKAVKAFIGAGVPEDKLVMGIAFYSRKFKIAGESPSGLGGKVASGEFGEGYTFLKDSLINKNGYIKYKDLDAKAPYLYNPLSKIFITYEDEWSVKNKCDYVKANKMAGVMFWEYFSDPKEYLLNEIEKNLR